MSYTPLSPSNLNQIDIATESGNWGDLRNGDFSIINNELRALYDYYIAGEDLSQFTVVGVNSSGQVIKCDSSQYPFKTNIIGITVNSVTSGEQGLIRHFGKITNFLWNWTPGLPLYFDSKGLLTQNAALQTAFKCIVGKALSKMTIQFQIETSIDLQQESGVVKEEVYQIAHGFSVGDGVGFSSGEWFKADASSRFLPGQGVVSNIKDPDSFTVIYFGWMNWHNHGLTIGGLYFVADGGGWENDPMNVTYQNPLIKVIDGDTVFILPWQGSLTRGSLNKFEETFTQSAIDPVTKTITLNHGLNSWGITLEIRDDSGYQVEFIQNRTIDNNTIELDLTAHYNDMTGTWRAILFG
ncbi:MAG: hypothetical protein F6K39_14830 [Okeania sp. SIO3B3]|nr:hypothetical protein [Okeania sp. SIO3B3]